MPKKIDKSDYRLYIASGFYEVKAYAPQMVCLWEAFKALTVMGIHHTYVQLCGDSYVDRCKNSLVHDFLKSDFTHLMIIDSDETWNLEGFARLVRASLQGHEIVAGLYPCKNNWEFYGGYHKEVDGFIQGYEDGDIRLIEMEIVPGGFIIYAREAFERTRPLLDSYVDAESSELHLECFRCNIEIPGLRRHKREELEGMEKSQLVDLVLANQQGGRKGGRTGEDIYFQNRFKEAGGTIFCEPNITMGHFGVKEWTGNYHEYLMRTRGINPCDVVPTNIHGFTKEEELDWLHKKAMLMDSVVEVGCYAGRSTTAILSGCKGEVYAVDDFRGIHHEKFTLKGMELEDEFDKNTKGFNNLIKIKKESGEAAKIIDNVDMVFIDGSHDYHSVKADIEAWLPKATKLICGHDYNNPDWPEVTKAVDDTLGKGRVKQHHHIWYLEKESA